MSLLLPCSPNGRTAFLCGQCQSRSADLDSGSIRDLSNRPLPAYLGVIAFALAGFSVLALLLPAVQVSHSGRRNLCMNNLHNIGLALANYHADHRLLSAGVCCRCAGASTGELRVLLLPYMERRQLYDDWKKHADEPWNGPNNSKLSKRSLEFLHCPYDPGPATETSYVAIVGPGTIWPGTGKVKQFSDHGREVKYDPPGRSCKLGHQLDGAARSRLHKLAPGVNSPAGLGVSSNHAAVACVQMADGRTITIPQIFPTRTCSAFYDRGR